jgi:hypothetical protein
MLKLGADDYQVKPADFRNLVRLAQDLDTRWLHTPKPVQKLIGLGGVSLPMRPCALVLMALLSGGGELPAPENPYSTIVLPNLFRLKSPKVDAVPAPLSVLPELKLLGVTTILAPKRAILKIRRSAIKGETASEETWIALEGQRKGAVEVIDIDEIAATVRVNNSGTEQIVTLEPIPKGVAVSAPAPPSPLAHPEKTQQK